LPCAFMYLNPAVTDKCATSSLAARARDVARTRPSLVLQLHRQVNLINYQDQDSLSAL
jgi:hypothetical protein